MAQTDSDPELNVDGNIWNHHPSVPIQIGGIFRNILKHSIEELSINIQ